MDSQKTQPKRLPIKVEPIASTEDFGRFFDIAANAFARQAKDNVWMTLHPGWDTPEGRENAISGNIKRWSSITKDRNGNPNTIFLKATVPRLDDSGKEDIAGVAIWAQASMVDGYGDAPTNDIDKVMDVKALYPGNATEQEYLRQLLRSFHARRVEIANEIASSSSPALMILDLCAVDPTFQRLGVATKLVQWGLDEAKRRGGMEATLEASSMGRHVYKKLGFRQEGGELQFQVDEQFEHRDRPSVVFMRTGRPVV
ncbi:hypothetical protein EIK77_005490 [Talaromyces pinophilus]|jgi:GNAT superfamily N-acetyltransferase|uniref:N-acetyltransferase domain-containing protein n=1 Tax=Talaromyces pinophilus TaxID=128442 RepID=A0A6V8HDJ6_TALPI|nr:hypothetical protein DPV78_002721 [Talaromyces pinophilus]KAI7975740.1 hypothetical protein EIK77_005490 [Talaromyces pinophilus]PCG99001.1 hypothetical protein PENOC_060470 [Penicillium occitanis (nom. inval.)]PCH05767.1 Acyl-CoA N-acyltransferase [Penicillium occitanis (nom. inval.)]GAM39562.1 hypothetical protein TCE0_034r11210 [Talaromyces pinophilus]